jgi:hypothetical protein
MTCDGLPRDVVVHVPVGASTMADQVAVTRSAPRRLRPGVSIITLGLRWSMSLVSGLTRYDVGLCPHYLPDDYTAQITRIAFQGYRDGHVSAPMRMSASWLAVALDQQGLAGLTMGILPTFTWDIPLVDISRAHIQSDPAGMH